MEGARPAAATDAGAIVDLARQGVAELTPNRGGAIWSGREAHADIEAVVSAAVAGVDAEGLAVVGTVDDVVVGYGLVRIEGLHDGRPLAVVSDLYVDPEARGIGIGEAMMDLMVAHARSAGAVGIDALALPGDRHTKNFFETFGLTARAILVHRSFEPTGGTEAIPEGAPAPGGD